MLSYLLLDRSTFGPLNQGYDTAEGESSHSAENAQRLAEETIEDGRDNEVLWEDLDVLE